MRRWHHAALILATTIAGSACAGETSQVERIFADCAGWMPEQYSAGMEQVEAIGSAAVPALIGLVDGENDPDRLWPLCEALARVPDARALPALGGHLDHPALLVRSACGSAYARSFAVGERSDDELRPLIVLVTADRDCTVRTNVASELGSLADPRLREYFQPRLFSADGCTRQVAIHGVAGTPEPDEEIGAALVRLFTDPAATDDSRETAAWALTEFHHPPARGSLLQYLKTGETGGNARAFAVEALGHIGLPADIALLRGVIADDPYDGAGVWAVRAREAITRIERRAAGQE
jgi:HEAT repeat protein